MPVLNQSTGGTFQYVVVPSMMGLEWHSKEGEKEKVREEKREGEGEGRKGWGGNATKGLAGPLLLLLWQWTSSWSTQQRGRERKEKKERDMGRDKKEREKSLQREGGGPPFDRNRNFGPYFFFILIQRQLPTSMKILKKIKINKKVSNSIANFAG